MLTLEQLSERLEALYVAVGTMYKNQGGVADEWYNNKREVAEAKALLESTRSSAVAAKAIQQKEHGANKELRDAHERAYLEPQHLALENAQLREQQARHDFDQIGREISGVNKQISLTLSQVQIHKLSLLKDGVTIYSETEE